MPTMTYLLTQSASLKNLATNAAAELFKGDQEDGNVIVNVIKCIEQAVQGDFSGYCTRLYNSAKNAATATFQSFGDIFTALPPTSGQLDTCETDLNGVVWFCLVALCGSILFSNSVLFYCEHFYRCPFERDVSLFGVESKKQSRARRVM